MHTMSHGRQKHMRTAAGTRPRPARCRAVRGDWRKDKSGLHFTVSLLKCLERAAHLETAGANLRWMQTAGTQTYVLLRSRATSRPTGPRTCHGSPLQQRRWAAREAASQAVPGPARCLLPGGTPPELGPNSTDTDSVWLAWQFKKTT